jgi:hypothetical protein
MDPRRPPSLSFFLSLIQILQLSLWRNFSRVKIGETTVLGETEHAFFDIEVYGQKYEVSVRKLELGKQEIYPK